MVPRTALWDAINRYVTSCGGDPSSLTVNDARVNAVAEVERQVDRLCSAAVNETIGEALNSGNGVYRP